MTISLEFERIFGVEPDVVASAPGRVNIIGEHIDYSDGSVLPFALPHRTWVAIRTRTDLTINIGSLQHRGEVQSFQPWPLTPDKQRGWVEYFLGVIRELNVERGLDILVDGHVPVGAGLSSSAALECATAVALNHVFGLEHTRTQLALACQAAENNFVGMPCGIMDQAVSMLAHKDHALLLDCLTLETTHVPLNIHDDELAILVIDTRAHHALVDGGYAARRQSCEDASKILGIPSLRTADMALLDAHRDELTATEYRRARHAITEIARVHAAVAALSENNFTELGRLLTASHISLRDDYQVSCPELDVAVDASLVVGALGARMVGGGFGGSAIALCPTVLMPAVHKSVRDAYSASGFTAPRFFVASAEAGARIEN